MEGRTPSSACPERPEHSEGESNGSGRAKLDSHSISALHLPIRLALRDPPLLGHFLQRGFFVDLLFGHELLDAFANGRTGEGARP